MNLATGFEPQFRTSPVLDPIGPLLSKGKGADLVIGLRVESKRAAPERVNDFETTDRNGLSCRSSV